MKKFEYICSFIIGVMCLVLGIVLYMKLPQNIEPTDLESGTLAGVSMASFFLGLFTLLALFLTRKK